MKNRISKHFRRGCSLFVSAAMLLQGWLTVLPAAAAETDNLANGAIATATFEQNDQYYKGNASNAVDGDHDTRWSSYDSTNKLKLPQAIQVDLGQAQELGSVVSYWFGDGRPYTYDLYLTNKPTITDSTFTVPTDAAYAQTDLSAIGSGDDQGNGGTLATIDNLDKTVTAQYITICCTAAKKADGSATQAAGLWEIEVYGSSQTPPKPQQKIRISCVGDSITAGSQASSPATNYVSQLQGRLGDQYLVQNFGVSGSTLLKGGTNSDNAQAGYVLTSAYQSSLASSPDVVTIMLGTNDSKTSNWQSPRKDTYEQELRELIQTYRDLDSQPLVILATSPTAYNQNWGISNDNLTNEIVPLQKKVAADMDCPLIDINAATKNMADNFADGIHPNDKGYALLADLFAAGIRKALTKEESAIGRQKITLQDSWKFHKGTAAGAQAVSYNDSGWEAVTLPHTWNAQDGQDGGNNYYKGDGWYRKLIPWNESYQGKQLFVEFMGANTQTEVYINGTKAGIHKGGFTAFRFDMTSYITPGEDILLAVRVNNVVSQEVAPISADFTFFGGIYREVSLLALEPAAHMDVLDNGSNGLYLTPTNVSAEQATLGVRSAIVNDSDTAQTVTVSAELRNPAPGSVAWIDEELLPTEWLPFDPADMTPGGSVKTITETLTIPAGESVSFDKSMTVENPRLWNGKTDPYRYEVELTVCNEEGEVLDQLSDFVGFRYDEVDNDKGYFLNGKSYPLRGVNRHQDRQDMGWAISNTEHAQDFALIYEIGANTIRLAHYPQADYFYDLCDMYGLVVWAEIPFVDQIGGSGTYEQPDATRAAFFETTKQQLTELIRQQYNHASIACWGLQNEIRYGDFEGVAQSFLEELNDLAHNEDPTRFTVQAIYNGTPSDTKTWPSDAVSWNLYPGWYYSAANKFGEDVDNRRRKDPDRPMGLSEYGYGSNIEHHQEVAAKPPKVDIYEAVESEEYQCWAHEQAWAAIEQREWLWATHVWNMFDFAVDKRNEAGYPGINNKGLVTYDRQTKKDVFYFYKANWSDQPFVHLNSSRFTVRDQDTIQVKGYSNLDAAELIVNGKSFGKLTQEELAQKTVFVWKDIPLQEGANTVTIRGLKDGKAYEDTVVWTRVKHSTDIQSDSEWVNIETKTIALRQPLLAEQAETAFWGTDGEVTVRVLQADGKTSVTTGTVQPGMLLAVTSEDGVETTLYTFTTGSLATGRPATATSCYGKENSQAAFAVDGNAETRWTADLTPNATYPASITVDLEQVYNLSRIETDWFTGTGTRSYYYTVEASEDGTDFAIMADHTNNTAVGSVNDNLTGVRGRYVRITVTGNSDLAGKPTASASLFELRVFGWELISSVYAIDHTARTILIPGAVSVEDFWKNITLSGSATAKLSTSYDTVNSGDKLELTDAGDTHTAYTLIRLGDVNQNGELDILDALMALQAAAEKITLSSPQRQAANVDAAADVTAYDALCILKAATHSISSL